jgi:dephospho-CoA kinase
VGRWANKYVIGLTGNIAMGKSLVRKMLENLGAYTIDADGLAHQAMAPGAPTYAPIVDTFGKWILDADKKIDRSRLGAVAFAHNDALNILEQITHPVVGQAIDILIGRAKQPIVVVEAIKLVDGVLGGQVDTIWVVDSTAEVQLQRLMQKRGMSDWEARKRIETQNPQRDKIAKANLVVTNNGSPDEVWAQVQQEWQRIITKLRGGAAPAPQPVQQPIQQPAAPVAQPVSPTPAATPAPAAPVAPSQPQPVTAQPVPVAQPVPAAASAAPAPAAPAAQPQAAPTPAAPAQIEVKRFGPKNAEGIAKFISTFTGRQVSRTDIMAGERSYLVAESGGRIIGIAGYQVENLITRMDEFFILPDAPYSAVAVPMLAQVEEASRDLQSEVGFIFVSRAAPPAQLQAFTDQGYERIEIEMLKVPAWREAAQELQSPEKQILMKKLRAERVLRPV